MLHIGSRAVGIAAVCGVAAMTAGCAGGAGNTTVVRIGDHAISKAAVVHWTDVLERQGGFTGYRGEAIGTPRQRALAVLISSDWLIGEAAQQGVPVSEDAVQKALRDREAENTELRAQIRQTGETLADLKLELRSELAAEALRGKLAKRASRIVPAEVVSFYRENPSLFGTGVRVTDLIEGQSSAAAARAAAPGLGTHRSIGGEAIREHVTREPWFTRSPEKVRAIDEIFAARPGVVGTPVLMNRSWAIFIVRKVIPGKTQPFAKARAEAASRLNERRQERFASEFDRYFTARWKARTSCQAGYVGPGCPQYGRPLGAYEDPFSTQLHLLVSEPLSRS
jgi:hypothetical protein